MVYSKTQPWHLFSDSFLRIKNMRIVSSSNLKNKIVNSFEIWLENLKITSFYTLQAFNLDRKNKICQKTCSTSILIYNQNYFLKILKKNIYCIWSVMNFHAFFHKNRAKKLFLLKKNHKKSKFSIFFKNLKKINWPNKLIKKVSSKLYIAFEIWNIFRSMKIKISIENSNPWLFVKKIHIL
jgi:hypothetical protein